MSTDIIVGFPGETDDVFTQTLKIAKDIGFSKIHVFTCSPIRNTPAAKMPDQISENVKLQRLEELMLTQQKIAFEKNKNRIGTQLTCLVDDVDSENEGRGRFYGQAPEIDSVCIIKKCSDRPGEFINTKVTGTKDYDLLVEQI